MRLMRRNPVLASVGCGSSPRDCFKADSAAPPPVAEEPKP